MNKKIVILGAGLVGKAMAIDLQNKYHTIAVDVNADNLRELNQNYGTETIQADVSKKEELTNVIKNCDIAIGALPSHISFDILKNVIQAGKHIVDICVPVIPL